MRIIFNFNFISAKRKQFYIFTPLQSSLGVFRGGFDRGTVRFRKVSNISGVHVSKTGRGIRKLINGTRVRVWCGLPRDGFERGFIDEDRLLDTSLCTYQFETLSCFFDLKKNTWQVRRNAGQVCWSVGRQRRPSSGTSWCVLGNQLVRTGELAGAY